MPSITILSAETHNEFGETTLFQGAIDALALVIVFQASADLMSMTEPMFQAIFEIIDPLTNQVVVSETWNMSPIPITPPGEVPWISSGNNWGPLPSDYSTPLKWGLTGPDNIYGFRALIQAYANGESIDAFDVSDIRWFRVYEFNY